MLFRNTVMRAFNRSSREDLVNMYKKLVFFGLIAAEVGYQGMKLGIIEISKTSANQALAISRWKVYANGLGAAALLAALGTCGYAFAEPVVRLMRAASIKKTRRGIRELKNNAHS